MNFPRRAAPALVLLMLTVGCGAKRTIVGKWQGNAPLRGRQTANAVMEFKADGTNTITAKQGAIAATIGGRYTVKNDTLEITLVTIPFNGKSIAVPPAQQVAESYTYKLDGDTLTLSNPKASLKLTRVKE